MPMFKILKGCITTTGIRKAKMILLRLFNNKLNIFYEMEKNT